MTLIISHEVASTLGFDLSEAVEVFSSAIVAHRSTIGVPAPTAHPLVETIVRQYMGQFSVSSPPEPEPDFPPEPEPETPLVPVSITPRQCRLLLLQVNLLDQVEAIVAQQSRAVQLAWEYATEFRRDDPLLLTLAGSSGLNLSSEQLDQFFIQAAAL